jgi:hypothetical protein
LGVVTTGTPVLMAFMSCLGREATPLRSRSRSL